jgi:hypothetical protein
MFSLPSFTIPIGKVKIPVIPIALAIPGAVRAAHAYAADDHEPSSPGGTATTAGEVTEAIGVFLTHLGQKIKAPVLRANGVRL